MTNIQEIATIVRDNTLDALFSLQEYIAIGAHAKKINESGDKFYFSHAQKVMLDYFVIKICAIYEKSRNPKQNTVYFLLKYAEKNINSSCVLRIRTDRLTQLGVSTNNANIETILKEIRNKLDSLASDSVYNQLREYRDKKLAHSD